MSDHYAERKTLYQRECEGTWANPNFEPRAAHVPPIPAVNLSREHWAAITVLVREVLAVCRPVARGASSVGHGYISHALIHGSALAAAWEAAQAVAGYAAPDDEESKT